MRILKKTEMGIPYSNHKPLKRVEEHLRECKKAQIHKEFKPRTVLRKAKKNE